MRKENLQFKFNIFSWDNDGWYSILINSTRLRVLWGVGKRFLNWIFINDIIIDRWWKKGEKICFKNIFSWFYRLLLIFDVDEGESSYSLKISNFEGEIIFFDLKFNRNFLKFYAASRNFLQLFQTVISPCICFNKWNF